MGLYARPQGFLDVSEKVPVLPVFGEEVDANALSSGVSKRQSFRAPNSGLKHK